MTRKEVLPLRPSSDAMRQALNSLRRGQASKRSFCARFGLKPTSSAGIKVTRPQGPALALTAIMALSAVIFLASPVQAQSPAPINGLFNDLRGAILPAVKLTVVNREIGLRLFLVADDNGRHHGPFSVIAEDQCPCLRTEMAG